MGQRATGNAAYIEEAEAKAQSQARLIWAQFKRHRLALVGLYVLAAFYLVCVVFPEFFAPYAKGRQFEQTYLPPQPVRFVDADGGFHIRPFVYNITKRMDPSTFELAYTVDTSVRYPIRFFVRGDEYKLWGLFAGNVHLFGVGEGGQVCLAGTDNLGRDLLSRMIYGGRISLTIGFVGVFIGLILGLTFGGLSGLLGGTVDDIIQRLIELLMSIPKLPLWMGLAAAIPMEWSAVGVYFAITLILSLMSWTGLARVVRSKFISLREQDFVSAAVSYNAPALFIISRHLIPNFISYIIINLTLTIPGMIIGETSLSFLGIGLRPPVVSLGVLLNQAQSFQTVSLYPWMMLPGFIVIVVVLCYNFVGDGLRDSCDPYKQRVKHA